MLICVIYKKIKNCVCIDYLACQSKTLSEISVGSGGGSKHGDNSFDRMLGIGNIDLLMNSMSCCRFLNNINTVVVLKFPKSMLKYYFSKVFTILEWNYNNLEKLLNDKKQRTSAEKNIIHTKAWHVSTQFPPHQTHLGK